MEFDPGPTRGTLPGMTRMPMRCQFRLWNLLAAIAWLALWLTFCNLVFKGALHAWMSEGFMFAAMVALPFTAIGALLGKF